ncbi:hypothetical protein [Synechococcus sp. C9]|uniref:hypothetical protein n=1 Tax=Synechococcus sp. C9 TaxID=102119 RepID=UPI001FF62FF9|nr:hypothetical protein [Synechococcus sp. C9]
MYARQPGLTLKIPFFDNFNFKLLQEFKGKIDLIDIDPTFDVGACFSMRVASL